MQQRTKSGPYSSFQATFVNSLLGFIDYLLKTSFSEDHASTFKLSCLIPSHLATLSRYEYAHAVAEINDVYSLENFAVEAMTLYDYWSALTQKPANIEDALLETNFHPAIKDALIVLVTLPASTCTVERSFSTVWRVNTWLRLMGKESLSGLCMASVHEETKSRKTSKDLVDVLLIDLVKTEESFNFCLTMKPERSYA